MIFRRIFIDFLSDANMKKEAISKAKTILRVVMAYIVMGAVFFIPAGTIDWKESLANNHRCSYRQ